MTNENKREFSYTAADGARYYLATGVDCDGQYYLYSEGTHCKTTQVVHPSAERAAGAFSLAVLNIIKLEHLA